MWRCALACGSYSIRTQRIHHVRLDSVTGVKGLACCFKSCSKELEIDFCGLSANRES
eukprot:m.325643 g.325643  ORF g.325643 m.325643 type:complete len:57 (+) comp16472_c1_seq37:3113-3283(+)